jgi:SPP1 family predicted phage head-tail adaptor
MASVNKAQVLAWTIGQLSPAARPMLDPRLLGLFSRTMNCRLLLQLPVDTDDGQGGKTRTWTAVYSVIGSVEGLAGSERAAEGGVGQAETHEILVPYQTGVDPTMRVRYGTRTFDIHTVTDYSEQHLLLSLMCEEQFRK